MTKVLISISEARRLAVNSQLLDSRGGFPGGKEGIARAIEHLGYIQIDTIAVIERAHHHTIWNRRSDYSHRMLHQLQAEDRRIFEYWGHAMSYLPVSDYRYYLPRMKRFADPYSKWEKARLEKYGHMMGPVLERISKEGPLSSKDFETPAEAARGGWWNWRPAKVALEMLFWQGKLMITERRNFQRVYDLTERVLPATVDTSLPTGGQLGRFFIGRALSAHGLATKREISEHIDAAEREQVHEAIDEMTEAGEIIKLAVTGIENSDYYARPEILEKLPELKKRKSRVFLLSPFDNLIIMRDRLSRLFNFDYALECYTPAAKRIHGYFVLPVLYGDKFVGRLDPKADRKTGTLIIRRLALEKDFEASGNFIIGLAQSLVKFMKFNACEKIKIEKADPGKIKAELNKQIKLNL